MTPAAVTVRMFIQKAKVVITLGDGDDDTSLCQRLWDAAQSAGAVANVTRNNFQPVLQNLRTGDNVAATCAALRAHDNEDGLRCHVTVRATSIGVSAAAAAGALPRAFTAADFAGVVSGSDVTPSAGAASGAAMVTAAEAVAPHARFQHTNAELMKHMSPDEKKQHRLKQQADNKAEKHRKFEQRKYGVVAGGKGGD